MLDTIREKLDMGRRLSAEEGLFLYRPDVDLHAVGELADVVRRRKCGDNVYYNINAHLNPTNVCIYRCELCAYSCDLDDPRAYLMSEQAMLDRAAEAASSGATELHIVGGIHPEKSYDWYLGIIRRLHEAFPRLMLKAWTAVEIARLAELADRPVSTVFEEMIEAGLTSLPGGGAEIFDPDVRRRICSRKIDADRWLDVHRTAHRLGLRSTATMLFGHLETAEHRIDQMLRLRELQDETAGFLAFIPLAFHPENTRLAHLRRPTGLASLRTMAVARLMLDNFDHLKAYWISLGVGTAQVALAYGADDIDGTVRHELIHHEAGSQSPETLTVARLEHLITEAGRRPVERDTLYRPVLRESGGWTIGS